MMLKDKVTNKIFKHDTEEETKKMWLDDFEEDLRTIDVRR